MSWKYNEDAEDQNQKALREAVAAEFKGELQALLRKYKATLEADDHYKGYPESGEDIRIEVTIQREDVGYAGLDLGRFVDGGS